MRGDLCRVEGPGASRHNDAQTDDSVPYRMRRVSTAVVSFGGRIVGGTVGNAGHVADQLAARLLCMFGLPRTEARQLPALPAD